MSLSTTFSAILLVVLGGMLGALLVRNTMLSGSNLPLPLSIEQIQELSELTTLCVQVSEVQEVKVQGYLGAVHALVLVQGEVEIGFDLSEARFNNIDSSNRTATLLLPEPTLRRPRLDHEKTRIVAVWQTGLWRWVPGQGEVNREIINQALQRAQHSLERPLTTELKSRSCRHATAVVDGFLNLLGWHLNEGGSRVAPSTMSNR
jgi:hypothetical protein